MRPLIGVRARQHESPAATCSWPASICTCADVAGLADGLQPGFRAVVADGRRRHDATARGFELAHAGGVERVDLRRPLRNRARHTARAIRAWARPGRRPGPSARAACRCQRDRPGTSRPASVIVGLLETPLRGAVTGPASASLARVLQHRAGQHILGFGMRRHAKTGNVDADDAHAVDLLRQQLQRHAAGRGHAQVDDDDAVVLFRVGLQRAPLSRMSSNSLPVTSVSLLKGT